MHKTDKQTNKKVYMNETIPGLSC